MKTKTALYCALVTLVAGAFSPAFAGQEELATAIQQTRTETILSHNELVANLKSLEALTSQTDGDLRPNFEAFKSGLVATRAASERTLKRTNALRADGDKYFATWQNEVAEIKDNGIRERALKRLEGTRKGWNSVSAALQEATTQFPSLLGYLTDIEKALNYDLTPDGVKSIKGSARSATDTFDKIQRQVQRAVTELETMAADMSSVMKKS